MKEIQTYQMIYTRTSAAIWKVQKQKQVQILNQIPISLVLSYQEKLISIFNSHAIFTGVIETGNGINKVLKMILMIWVAIIMMVEIDFPSKMVSFHPKRVICDIQRTLPYKMKRKVYQWDLTS